MAADEPPEIMGVRAPIATGTKAGLAAGQRGTPMGSLIGVGGSSTRVGRRGPPDDPACMGQSLVDCRGPLGRTSCISGLIAITCGVCAYLAGVVDLEKERGRANALNGSERAGRGDLATRVDRARA